MKKVIKVLSVVQDIIEIYIPVATFVILFISFVWAVFARYVLNSPPAWGTEIQVASYIWTVLLGACYVRRIDKHVCFTMVYDALPSKGQRIMRIARNSIMGIAYLLLIKPAFTYLINYRTISPSLGIPVKIYFFPIFILILGVCVYSFSSVVKDIIAKEEASNSPEGDK